jgi:hypothetical protein
MSAVAERWVMAKMPEFLGSGMLGSAANDSETFGGVGPLRSGQFNGPTHHGAEFDAYVEDIRRRAASDTPSLFTRFEDRLRRRLGIAPLRVGSAVFTGLVGVGLRLAVALLATAVFGEWVEIPWGSWALILAFFGLLDVITPFMNRPLDMPSSPWAGRIAEDQTALLTTIVHEPDLKDLADYAHRWYRLSVTVGVSVFVTAAVLLACWVFTPSAMSELPAGSIVLLTFLLLAFGEAIVLGSIFLPAFLAREARYDHHLFWPSPVDSPQVKKSLRMGADIGFITGIWITIYLALVVVLVSWDSPMVVPLAMGFVLIGYGTVVVGTLMSRGSIHRIVERTRDKWLAVLQHRIDAFGPLVTDLSAQESERLRQLIDLHNTIRDAPTTPTTTRTVMHTAVGLVIPSIMFFITVFGEVYVERFLDAILP